MSKIWFQDDRAFVIYYDRYQENLTLVVESKSDQDRWMKMFDTILSTKQRNPIPSSK